MSNKDLEKTKGNDVANFLKKVAATPAAKSTQSHNRLLFAMDATASRAHLWEHAMTIQSDMFAETIKLGGLAIQLAYYNNHSTFHKTAWHTQAIDLLAEMRRVRCISGMTQIGKVFSHAIEENKHHKLKAMVFVGDCIEENPQHIEQLAGQLSLTGVPAFMFQEGHDPLAESTFRRVANITRGAYCRFDASSAQQLRELLQAVAVYAAGGRKALDQFTRPNKHTLANQIRGQLPKL